MEAAVGAIRAYFTPIVALLGLLGNAGTLVIFINEARLHGWTRFGVYCVSLAVSDSCVLLFNGILDDFLGRGIAYASGGRILVKLDTRSDAACKLMEYLPHVSIFVSAYLLLAFSIDRLLTIYWPLQLMTRHHIRAAVIVVACLSFGGLLIMLPTIIAYSLQVSDLGVVDGVKCDIASSNSSGVSCGILYFKTFGVFVVPLSLQIIVSLLILMKLISVNNRRAQLMPTAQENKLELTRVYANLVLSIAYCLLVLPLCIVIVMRTRAQCWGDDAGQTDSEFQVMLSHLSRLFDSIKDVNYAACFWVYLAFVSTFRRRFLVAIAYTLVGLRCDRLCPGLNTSKKVVEIVNRHERKRRPTLQVVAATAAS